MKLRTLLALLTLSLLPLMIHCAPTNAYAVREAHPFTIGLVGTSFRPSGGIGIGVVGNFVGGSEEMSTSSSTSDSDCSSALLSTAACVTVREKSTGYAGFAQFFVSDKSAFFLGIGAGQRTQEYSFPVSATDTSAGMYTYTKKKTYIGMPIGWAWIWKTGFSLTLDFGPQIPLSSESEKSGTSNSGTDKIVTAIDKKNAVTFGFSNVIGWSF